MFVFGVLKNKKSIAEMRVAVENISYDMPFHADYGVLRKERVSVEYCDD